MILGKDKQALRKIDGGRTVCDNVYLDVVSTLRVDWSCSWKGIYDN